MQYATVRFVEQLGEIQSTVFDRVLLRFDADHGGATDDVVAKARASLATRPDATGHDAVAWTLYRARCTTRRPRRSHMPPRTEPPTRD